MLKSILIGLNGSESSHAAVDLAIRWAQHQGSLLVGLGIVDEPTITRSVSVPLGAGAYKKQRDAAMMEEARKRVDQFLSRFSLTCTQAQVASKPLEDVGLPWEMIVLEAQRYDMVMLGQHSDFHFETQDYDGTLRNVLKHSPRPVVVVPDSLPVSNSVLMAYDGSQQAARTLHALMACGLASNEAGVHVLSCDEDHTEAAQRADRALEFLRFHGITAHVHACPADDSPADAILASAEQLDAGLIAMGCYGKQTLRDLFFGSVTRRMLDQSKRPLFLYH